MAPLLERNGNTDAGNGGIIKGRKSRQIMITFHKENRDN